MAQQMLIGRGNTSVFVDDIGYTNVILHSTCVIKFNHKEIIFNSGNWRTSTTKTRMNQASNQFKLGFKVNQKNFKWFVTGKNFKRDFYDGMVVDRDLLDA